MKKINRLLVMILVFILAAGTAFSSAGTVYAAGGPSKAKSIKLNHKIITVRKGNTIKLTATVKPKSAKKKVVWKSSNKKIATVSKSGKVKAKKKGKVKITASIKGTKKKAVCTVYVGTPVKRVILTKKSATITQGKTVKIKAKLSPKKPTVKGFKFKSSNRKVATVSSKGVVKAKSPGKAVITVRSKDEAGKAAKFSVTVKSKTKTAEDYKYEVVPLTAPFNRVFYIKTDNPDPDSFCFADESTVYSDKGGSIAPATDVFADVVYENQKTGRVSGGYLAYGSYTDGGKLKLKRREVTGTSSVYNMNTGETEQEKEYTEYDTDVSIEIPQLKNTVDYLIDTYGNSSLSYFDNLTAIENGFASECLYSGIYVLGKQMKSTSMPYYGLSTSPHVDQIFYIQEPYYREGSKPMLVTQLYPLMYDSYGFPSVMASIAQKLNPNASVEWSSAAHYLIDVTLNGETRSYGGAGNGKGQGINANQIKYWFRFDNSSGDSYPAISIATARNWITEYSSLDVPGEPKDQPELTWAAVRNKVGKDGSYVKLILITSIYGGTSEGYTFMYDDGSTSEGTNGWGSVGYFSNTWYDGRYFNRWEFFYPGAEFEETVKTEGPSIVIKDPVIKLPDDGREYLYNYRSMDEAPYDSETGVWKGFMTYFYDSANKVWKCDLPGSITYREDNKYNRISDQDFVDECTITMEEALAMNLDANTNKNPGSFLNFNGQEQPGTPHYAK